ncbi:hypothetical protein TorRG33x02_138780 [Trema orientale]|uniref:DUF4283 domain-containing protein n=1 Tax=Trema orientale TaxID=63057 RepID=A0A2P5EXG3_TREOI|nr:hypothetical protein TorRG33x02_138780 [Trema orientale]
MNLVAESNTTLQVRKMAILAKLISKKPIHKNLLCDILDNIWAVEAGWKVKEQGREWPKTGYWYEADFDKAPFWVQAHGLPMQYLTVANIPAVADKVGVLIHNDERRRKDIIRMASSDSEQRFCYLTPFWVLPQHSKCRPNLGPV